MSDRAGVSGGMGSNELYENRRRERVIGLSIYGTLIDLQNFLQYISTYSWREEDQEMVQQMRDTAQNCYNAMKIVEQSLLQISDTFYAPIIPTENAHKIKETESGASEKE